MGVLNQLSVGLVVLFTLFTAVYLSSVVAPVNVPAGAVEPVRNVAVFLLLAALAVGYAVAQYEPECKR